MPLYTDHLNLAKPTRDERYNIAVPNANMDMIDETIQRLEGEVVALREELNKTSPNVYSLELPEGYKEFRACYFHINQFNEITVHFSVVDIEGEPTILPNETILFTMPEGFRPKEVLDFSVVALDPNFEFAAGLAHLDTEGNLTVGTVGPTRRVHGHISYLAAQ